jgi:hypothetical protein
MVGMINKFITDKTKIYLAYKVDGHIYRQRERERERERERVYVHWRKI